MDDFTRKFSIAMEKDAEIHQILSTVYQALEEKGYNPINQIVGYILSEDPTYITNHNNARTLIRKIDRDHFPHAVFFLSAAHTVSQICGLRCSALHLLSGF